MRRHLKAGHSTHVFSALWLIVGIAANSLADDGNISKPISPVSCSGIVDQIGIAKAYLLRPFLEGGSFLIQWLDGTQFHWTLAGALDDIHTLHFNDQHAGVRIVDRKLFGQTVPNNFDTRISGSSVGKLKRQVLEEIYTAFGNQGPERRTEVENYQLEDKNFSGSVITFLHFHYPSYKLNKIDFEREGKMRALFHFQVQLSDSPASELNTERHLKRRIPRKEKERWGDFGRLLRLNPEISLYPEGTPFQTEDPLPTLSSEEILMLTFQRALSWSLNVYKIEKGVFQVNAPVLRKLKSVLGPQFGSQQEVRIGDHDAKEWIVILDRAQMERLEEKLLAKLWDRLIQDLSSRNLLNQLADFSFIPSTYERPSLKRIMRTFPWSQTSGKCLEYEEQYGLFVKKCGIDQLKFWTRTILL